MRRRTLLVTLLAGLTLAGSLTGCAQGGPAPAPTPVTTATTLPNGFNLEAAQKYCVDKGGSVQSRQPMAGTSTKKADWVALGEPVTLCRFQADDKTDSTIFVDLVTLYSMHPTLAALAYLSKTPPPASKSGSSPARALCTKLGGASSLGLSETHGGLINENDAAARVVLPCVFADRSLIDAWGIAYYATATIHGVDLSTVFRFDQDDVPSLYTAP